MEEINIISNKNAGQLLNQGSFSLSRKTLHPEVGLKLMQYP